MIFKGTKKFPSLLNNLFSFEYFSQAGVRYKAPCVELYMQKQVDGVHYEGPSHFIFIFVSS
jgi:hypothetical protein